MNWKPKLTRDEAFTVAKKHGHTFLAPKSHSGMHIHTCKKLSCNASLIEDAESQIYFGSAVTQPCKNYRDLPHSHCAPSIKSPYIKEAKKTRGPDYSYVTTKGWQYDGGRTIKMCPDCKLNLYRMVKFEDGIKYVGFFCEKCKNVYNVGRNIYHYHKLVAHEKCLTLGSST